MILPAEYVDYLTANARREGSLAIEPGWFQLWPLTEIEHLNRAYEVGESAPGFLGFGSNGGGELLAFDSAGRVFMLPFIDMSSATARLIAGSWSEFVLKMEG